MAARPIKGLLGLSALSAKKRFESVMIASAVDRLKHLVGQGIERLNGQRELADAAAVFGVRILSALLAFGVQIFLARSLDLTEYGVYVTLWTWLIVPQQNVACVRVFRYQHPLHPALHVP